MADPAKGMAHTDAGGLTLRAMRYAPTLFTDGSDQPDAPDPRDWLAGIIEGSDDAIISKDLDGVIRSWNGGATRLFGYTPEEAVGRPVTMLIPEDRLDEEPRILAGIRAGERFEHFETVRRRKDGTLVDISLTISPIRNRHGAIVGASKIARDITERRMAQEQQQLLLGEMHHRVKNLFALATAIVSFSVRSARDPAEAPQIIQARLAALARAHDITMTAWRDDGREKSATDLQSLLQIILEPYQSADRIVVSGDNPPVGPRALTNLALLLHELATNAAKYGALSTPVGFLNLQIVVAADVVRLLWREQGGPVAETRGAAGFGSRLEQGLAVALGARVTRDWQATGLAITIEAPAEKLAS
ncbi:hypothetical protein GCM10019059_24450 [Camelimonas fluminis]|nr:hypothetical protein GCM10019059_24450 [Camelimonas fluminis]